MKSKKTLHVLAPEFQTQLIVSRKKERLYLSMCKLQNETSRARFVPFPFSLRVYSPHGSSQFSLALFLCTRTNLRLETKKMCREKQASVAGMGTKAFFA